MSNSVQCAILFNIHFSALTQTHTCIHLRAFACDVYICQLDYAGTASPKLKFLFGTNTKSNVNNAKESNNEINDDDNNKTYHRRVSE